MNTVGYVPIRGVNYPKIEYRWVRTQLYSSEPHQNAVFMQIQVGTYLPVFIREVTYPPDE